MMKKAFLTLCLACFALSAKGQIATPQLDAGFHTYGGAATGWRYGSTVNLIGVSAEGKVKSGSEEIGDVTYGINAKGPNDSSNPTPFFLAAYKGESISAELYTNLGDGLKSDVNFNTGTEEMEYYTEEKEMRLNFSYMISDSLSLGLGYRTNKQTIKDITIQPGNYRETKQDFLETGTSLSASLRLLDIFFVAGGYEMVNQTGTREKTEIPGTNEDNDYKENSWNNSQWAVAFVLGEPGETQFRAEYGQISSPESEEEAELGSTTEVTSSHAQTTTNLISAEIKFGSVLLGYYSETEDWAEINNEERKMEQTAYGVGWQPSEGLTFSLYSFNFKTKVNDLKNDVETQFDASGFRFFIGYNF